jgi:crotonobetaine/carnitine-CoA ligase
MTAGATTYAAAVWGRAERDPDSEVLRTTDGTRWTAGALCDLAGSWAAALAPVVGRGDVVATCVDASPEAVAVTAAISALGGVELPLGADTPPEWARHLVLVSGARLVVSSTSRARHPLTSALAGVTGHPLELVDGPSSLTAKGVGRAVAPVRLSDTDPAVIVSTSGTTGRAKAALLPAGAPVAQARRVSAAMAYGPDDVLATFFPWHHVNARHAAVLPALISGARAVMAPRFSASGFLDLARREQVTAFNFLGAVCMMLLRQPPGPGDRDHCLVKAYGGPAPAALVSAFRERFGVVLRQAYACTELGDVATTPMTSLRPGAAGRPVDDHEVRIVLEDSTEAADGESGEILVRPRRAGLALLEYVGDPEATSAAWADGWFRTRDRGRLVDGWLQVEGRSGDVIRRRGVNIDPHHVEEVLRAHPGVVDAAAIAVPSELTEDEVLALVVPHPGADLDAGVLWAQCAARLPRSLRPRYLSIETALPYTTGHKLDRAALRRRGLPASCFDSELVHPDAGSPG